MWEKLILPTLGRRRLDDITLSDISELHRRITVDGGAPVRANRVVAVLRKALYLAIDWGWCSANPVAKVPRNAKEPRHRHLSPEELRRLFSALDAHSEPVSAAAIRFPALTGARTGKVLAARWSIFDLGPGSGPSRRPPRNSADITGCRCPAPPWISFRNGAPPPLEIACSPAQIRTRPTRM